MPVSRNPDIEVESSFIRFKDENDNWTIWIDGNLVRAVKPEDNNQPHKIVIDGESGGLITLRTRVDLIDLMNDVDEARKLP